ncbi:MAG: putative lipid II flippase FtsW [Bacteroidia bacterium]|nr:putative lipid II flippase FtsW [Bacteroidia bacterium]
MQVSAYQWNEFWGKRIWNHLRGDHGIWVILIVLSCFSLLAVYSSTAALAFKKQSGNTEYYLLKHSILLVLSLIIAYFTHKIDYRIFAKVSTPLLMVSVLFLAYTLLQGEADAINGAKRWINVFGLSFQPSDLAKISLLVYLAKRMTEKQDNLKDFQKGFLPVILIVSLICGLIAPTNLSTALLLFLTSILLMFIGGISMKHIGGMALIGIIGLVILVQFAPRAKTWKSRIEKYVERWTGDEYEPHYQTIQSNIALARGGLFGNGIGKSIQRNYLPHPYSDFVYATIVEEFGLVGGLIVLFCYIALLFRSVAIATVSKTFGALLAAGLGFLIVIQAVVNIGVTVGLLPVTGLPLPLISMGGTSLIFTGLSIGIILSVSRTAIEERLNVPTA